MRLVRSHFLRDPAEAASLIQIETPTDFEQLFANILDTRYYDDAYFQGHSGYRARRWHRWSALRRFAVIPHFWCVAEMVRMLDPRRVLEVGCGRGDVLALLRRRGVDVTGIDFAEAARERAWPEVRPHLHVGDFVEEAKAFAARGERFDTLLGFDVWEHLPPSRLSTAIGSLVGAASEAGLFLFVVPGFGPDRVYGEQFPLEFEETREAFDQRRPFAHLLAERTSPAIPASGHLIWAHTEWWEAQFLTHGLRRETELERKLHALFDPLLPHSVKAFYLFSHSATGRARAERAMATPPMRGTLAQVAALRRWMDWKIRLRDAVPKPLRVLRRRLMRVE